jgi:hypothetical protein
MDTGIERLVTPIYYEERDETVLAYHEFAVPANAVSDDGYLGVAFFNSPALNNTTVVLEDVEVLYHSGSFETNYVRSLVMIYVAVDVFLPHWVCR